MKTGGSHPASRYRVQARRLLDQLRRPGSREEAVAAAVRFRRLRSFSAKTIDQIRGGVRLKHALAVIALEHGHESWRAFKEFTETGSRAPGAGSEAPGREMYAPGFCGLLNRWFARYEDARASLERRGGFLLPFERQFFVCEEEGIKMLGLEPEDPDWELIGRDWVKPRDPEAWLRLRRKREQALQGL